MYFSCLFLILNPHDVSNSATYDRFKPGSLVDVCLDFFGFSGQTRRLQPRHGLPDRERLRLSRFLTGLRVTTRHGDPSGKTSGGTPRVIKKLSDKGAQDMRFALREGGNKTVAAYFKETYNITLQFPDMICIEVR